MNTYGGTVAVVADNASPALADLRSEMKRSDNGAVSVRTLRGFVVRERETLESNGAGAVPIVQPPVQFLSVQYRILA